MNTNLSFVMDKIFQNEGGWAIRDSEPGGCVNFGICFLVYQGWRSAHKLPAPTFDDLKHMKRDEAEDIYEALYFAPCRFDQLQSGVDYALIDFAVNSGVGGAISHTLKALGFQHSPTPWRMGNDLLWALKTREPRKLITDICDARWALMQQSKNFPRFESGWKHRLDRVRVDADKLVT